MKSPQTRLSAALGVVAVHNITQNTVLNERGYVTASIAATAALVALGRDAELDWEELGLTAGDGKRTLLATSTSALAGATLMIMATVPATRRHMRDRRAPGGSAAAVARRATTRFPLGTALFEEVAFRGVLPALMRQAGWLRADAVSAALFGIWHLLPADRALRVNEVGRGRMERIGGVVLGATAAGMAGFGLGRVKRFTGSLLGPWAVHSFLNAGAYLASVVAGSSSS